MSDAIKIVCPHCRKISRIPASLAGRQGLCPGCKKAIEVPGKPNPDVADDETIEVAAPKVPAKPVKKKLKATHAIMAVLALTALVLFAAKPIRDLLSPVKTVSVPGQPAINYSVCLPDDYAAGNTYPLMLFLHPNGQGQAAVTHLQGLANVRGIIVAGSSDFANHVESNVFGPQIEKTLDHLTTLYSVDPERIYLAGFSGGGMGCYVSAHCIHTYEFAGLIVNGGVLHHFMREDPAEIKNMHAKRVVILSGDYDDLNPPSVLERDKELLESQGLEVHMLSFRGRHTFAPVTLFAEALQILDE